MRLESSFSSKAPGESNDEVWELYASTRRESTGERDQERVKAHGKETVSEGKANYAQCHVPPLFYGAGWNAHEPSEIGIDDFQSTYRLTKSIALLYVDFSRT
jgi:hypothetical protein